MGGTAALIIGAAALIVGPLTAWIVANRRLSGKIGTSDAKELWAAAEAMRGEYREQLEICNKRLVKLEGRLAEVEHENNTLANENLLLKRKIDLLERENERLRDEVEALKTELHEREGK